MSTSNSSNLKRPPSPRLSANDSPPPAKRARQNKNSQNEDRDDGGTIELPVTPDGEYRSSEEESSHRAWAPSPLRSTASPQPKPDDEVEHQTNKREEGKPAEHPLPLHPPPRTSSLPPSNNNVVVPRQQPRISVPRTQPIPSTSASSSSTSFVPIQYVSSGSASDAGIPEVQSRFPSHRFLNPIRPNTRFRLRRLGWHM